MNYLSQQAAIHAATAIASAIKVLESNIQSCGELTHKDAKQSDKSKQYFDKQLEKGKADIEMLKKLQKDLIKQSWQAYEQPPAKE
jgi:hypothetical protein